MNQKKNVCMILFILMNTNDAYKYKYYTNNIYTNNMIYNYAQGHTRASHSCQ